MDYYSEWSNLVGPLIPEWFYLLSATVRNDVMAATYAEYESVTIAKNDLYTTYFNNYLLTYAPP